MHFKVSHFTSDASQHALISCLTFFSVQYLFALFKRPVHIEIVRTDYQLEVLQITFRDHFHSQVLLFSEQRLNSLTYS